MATMPPSSLQLSNPFPLASSSTKSHAPKPLLSFTTRATDSETPPSEPSSESGSEPDDFDSKLSQVRLRYRSGTGKRKRSSGRPRSQKAGPDPHPGPTCTFHRCRLRSRPYSERVNGRIATLGLTALLLVELATGKSVLKYHSPSVVLIQVYFVAAVAAVYIKYEKEKVSVWPQSSPPPKD
ncbi:uncharacterized protein Pyn_13909 [Prunus yedoensis var. nudiflora]|uniref:Uncharacterized protein n=1 Tax=Prunus yedoensis var. nudiflora TaxID=2094558 RepID=A0A315AQC1_PRUYE|nr:uncharacterized protein Pyn_13909 [Prunus yedoensis var. nudiflora]